MFNRFSITLALTLTLEVLASAQTTNVVYHEDFGSGLAGWTATGLWNAEAPTDTCGSFLAPFPGGGAGAYWGLDSLCNNGVASTLAGTLTLDNPISVPDTQNPVWLRYWEHGGADCFECGQVIQDVLVSSDQGMTWSMTPSLSFVSHNSSWRRVEINLNSYRGQDILLRFRFDATGIFNPTGIGWMISDVRVETTSLVPEPVQAVLYHEDFEGDHDGWTTTGLWHLENDGDTCGSTVAPFPVGAGAAHWGVDSDCSFSVLVLSGDLTMIDPVPIPDTSDEVRLRFFSYDGTECLSCEWDWRFVYVRTETSDWELIGESQSHFEWAESDLDLSAYRGESIRLRFHFDAVDPFGNSSLGWMLDDVKIVVPCAEPTTFCQTSPNSVTGGATIGWNGSLSVVENDFRLLVADAPPNVFGKFYYGPAMVSVPFGNGVRCVTGGTFRLYPVRQADGLGTMTRHLDFSAPPADAGPGAIQPGDTWYFQFWYRDQAAGGAGFNLSDGLAASFCP